MSDITKNVLNRLSDLFEVNYIPATFRELENEGVKTDILCSLHDEIGEENDEIMGEFFFIELPDGSYLFNAVMTLSEELNSEFLIPLNMAILRINPYLVIGGFVTDATDTKLYYKFSTPISGALKEEELWDQIDLCVGHTLSICEKYAGVLLDVSEGEGGVEEVTDLLINI